MILRCVLRLALPIVLSLVVVSIFDALATANVVSQSGKADVKMPITADTLKPPECAALTLTSIVVGSGTINGGTGNSLILGSSASDTIRGQTGADCILGGGGNDSIRGRGGNDVLLGGPGADTLNGGSGADVCYGYNGTTSGGGIDTFTGCESRVP